MRRIRLRHMKKHQTGRIAAIRAEGALGRRIRDMGILPGAEIRVQGRAPLYDPVVVKLGGFTLALRNNEADTIDVEVE